MPRIDEETREQIKTYLREGELKQVEISKITGVHKSTISRINKAMMVAEEKINWGDKVRQVLAGFLHLGYSVNKVAQNCSVSQRALSDQWRSESDAFERTYRALGYAAVRIFEESLTPEMQLKRLEDIGRTLQTAMGSISWSVVAKRTVWIREHRGVD